MGPIASQITSLTIVYSTVYSDANQRKHQSSASLAFVRGIHRGPVNSPHKWPVTRKMFPFDYVIMKQWLVPVQHRNSASTNNNLLPAESKQILWWNFNQNIHIFSDENTFVQHHARSKLKVGIFPTRCQKTFKWNLKYIFNIFFQ